mgnify:CR=1 FL=1
MAVLHDDSKPNTSTPVTCSTQQRPHARAPSCPLVPQASETGDCKMPRSSPPLMAKNGQYWHHYVEIRRLPNVGRNG